MDSRHGSPRKTAISAASKVLVSALRMASSPGVIDQADYAFWKANFGNTFAGSGGAALASTRSVLAIAEEILGLAKSDALATGPLTEPLDNTVQFDSAIRSRFIPTVIVVPRDPLRSSSSRAGQRDSRVIAARHDRALVAWLAARPAEPRDELPAASMRELPSEPNVCDPSHQFIERLDNAFESLGV